MTAVTLALIVAFGALASVLRPGQVVGLLVFSLLIWPEYLRVPVFVVQLSVPRAVALVAVARFAFSSRQPFTLARIDFVVISLWLWDILAGAAAGGGMDQITRMIGRGLDTVLVYFAVRLCIRSLSDLKQMVDPVLAIAVYAGLLGCIEAYTSYGPYQELSGLRGWAGASIKAAEYRFGLLRANMSTSVSIYFGLAMVMIFSLLWPWRAQSSVLMKLGLALAFFGALSSMSSGPWVACFLTIVLLSFESYPKLILPSLAALLVLAILAELFSNRHIYELIDYFAIDKRNGWYRTRLVEIAVSNLKEYWIFGYGGAVPHHWAEQLDGRGHIDIVNHFVIVGTYGGLPGLSLYLCMQVAAIRSCIRSWRTTNSDLIRKCSFSIGSAIIVVNVTSYSVGLFGPPLVLSYFLFAVAVSLGQFEPVAADLKLAEDKHSIFVAGSGTSANWLD